MQIKIDNRIYTIAQLNQGQENNGVFKRNVTFDEDGKKFDLDIILGSNGTGIDYTDPLEFYLKNQDEVHAALQVYNSQTEGQTKN